ncbi:hypothetical protein NQ117_08535 [Paenibacillus sp. SC116]|uniref:sensor histidine kinase n=1 Tax=Paenibacillus sp. SC116 TaxID=2968986 RepID=UPI00215B4AED|nr:hypothetical protein [Paenibacillus sp. SC116]MCR8843732.1 hypothetical protein [Paenibacillus sp. SC116]
MNLTFIRKCGLIALGIVYIWLIIVTFSHPFIGVYAKFDDNYWRVSYALNGGVGADFHIQKGDRLIEVNGQPAETHFYLQKWGKLEQADNVLLERDGHYHFVSLTHGEPHQLYDVLPVVSMMFLLFIAQFLYRRRGASTAIVQLSLLFLSISLVYIAYGASIRGDIVGRWLMYSGIMILPILFLQFICSFIQEKSSIKLPMKHIKWLYGLLIICLVVKWMYLLTQWSYASTQFDDMITYLFFAFVIGVTLIYITRLYLRFRHERSYFSSVVFIVFVIVSIAAIPVIGLSFIPHLMGLPPLVPPLVAGWIAIMMLLVFALLTMRYQLNDIGVILRRLFVHVLIAMVPSALILGWYGVVFTQEGPFSYQFFTYLFMVFVITAITHTLDYHVNKLESVLIPRKHKLHHALIVIAERLGQHQHHDEWYTRILPLIMNALDADGVALVRKDHLGTIEMSIEGDVDQEKVERQLKASHFRHHHYFWYDINLRADSIYYVVIVRKSTKAKLNHEEDKWMQQVITYLSLSLNHIYHVQTLRTQLSGYTDRNSELRQSIERNVMGDLFDMDEQERSRFSAEIQKRVMRLLHDVTVALEESLHSADTELNKEMHKIVLVEVKESIFEVNSQLQHLCQTLKPTLLKTAGFANALRQWIAREFTDRTKVILHVDEPSLVLDIQTEDWVTGVFRISQLLLYNGKVNGYATELQLQINVHDGYAHIVYRDNGIGFHYDMNEVVVEEYTFKQLRNRVSMLDGKFVSTQYPDQIGSYIQVNVPLSSEKQAEYAMSGNASAK